MTEEGNGAKSLILSRIYDQLQDMEQTGCRLGATHTSLIAELMRRMGDVETKFWSIVILLVSNLAATVTVIIRGD